MRKVDDIICRKVIRDVSDRQIRQAVQRFAFDACNRFDNNLCNCPSIDVSNVIDDGRVADASNIVDRVGVAAPPSPLGRWVHFATETGFKVNPTFNVF